MESSFYLILFVSKFMRITTIYCSLIYFVQSLYFLTVNFFCKCHIFQSSWLLIRRPGFDSRHYQKKKVVGPGTGSTQPRENNWVATWWKSSGSCLENREYGRRDPSRWLRGTLYPQKFAITSPTDGGRSVGVIRSRTQTMEFSLVSHIFFEIIKQKAMHTPKLLHFETYI
jgi:hypothetical protein